ncbi:WXG100 family type VII secretion target [Catellatospora citrea]|uniref:WXG100 family type VII secretion target n=1 Tax=Catellatospora citrea TaxID=53366 RepID=A0A8J3KJ42_9ACTN|nr:hypothetical protein [Catellatospora citrea]RKE05583.1 hypothetical protein C8E86_0387 [Catellatospora citrea]GIF96934.1 hypothetical protein Cci01nite_20280 [Catellatospora citrea]
MARQLKVDPGTVDGIGHRLLMAGSQVDLHRQDLERGLGATASAWGRDDEFARKFVEQYRPGRDEVLEGTRNLAQLLTDMGHHVRTTRRFLGAVEHDNT